MKKVKLVTKYSFINLQESMKETTTINKNNNNSKRELKGGCPGYRNKGNTGWQNSVKTWEKF